MYILLYQYYTLSVLGLCININTPSEPFSTFSQLEIYFYTNRADASISSF